MYTISNGAGLNLNGFNYWLLGNLNSNCFFLVSILCFVIGLILTLIFAMGDFPVSTITTTAVILIGLVFTLISSLSYEHVYQQAMSKINFARSNEKIPRIYHETINIGVSLKKNSNAATSDYNVYLKNGKSVQYVHLVNSNDITVKPNLKIMKVVTDFAGKKSTIKLIPLNKIGQAYSKVCWYVAKQPHLYNLKIDATSIGTIATYNEAPDSKAQTKVMCLINNKPSKETNNKVIKLKLN